MSSAEKLLKKVLGGKVGSIRFSDLKKAMEAAGFRHDRTRGSHFIMKHPSLSQPLPIQEGNDGMAKRYQVAQFREALRYLGGNPTEGKKK